MGIDVVGYCKKCDHRTAPLMVGGSIDSPKYGFRYPAYCLTCKAITTYDEELGAVCLKCGEKNLISFEGPTMSNVDEESPECKDAMLSSGSKQGRLLCGKFYCPACKMLTLRVEVVGHWD